MIKTFALLCGILLWGIPGYAIDIGFEELAKAVEGSPAVLQSKIQTEITKQEIEKARSAYWPSLAVGFSTEYSKKFDDLYTPAYVGDDSLTQSTGYHASSTIALSYGLLNFMTIDEQVNATSAKATAAKAEECLVSKEKLAFLLESYHQARVGQIRERYFRTLSQKQVTLYQMAKRLNAMGSLPAAEVIDYAKEIADTATELANIQEERFEYLAQITYLSGVQLKEDDVLQPLLIGYKNQKTHFEESANAKKFRALIQQKEAEYKIAKLKYIPQFSLYYRYDFYGQDYDQYFASYRDLQRNGYRVGLSVSWSIFDGFNREAEISTKLLELRQAKIGLEEAKRDFEKEQKLLSLQKKSFTTVKKSVQDSSGASEEIADIHGALHKSGNLDKISSLKSEIGALKMDLKAKEADEKLAMIHKKAVMLAQKESECVVH